MLTNSLSKTTSWGRIINLRMFFWHILVCGSKCNQPLLSTESLQQQQHLWCISTLGRPPTMSSLEIFNEMRRDFCAHGQKLKQSSVRKWTEIASIGYACHLGVHPFHFLFIINVQYQYNFLFLLMLKNSWLKSQFLVFSTPCLMYLKRLQQPI